MNTHTAIVFETKAIVIADNTFYNLFNGIKSTSNRNATVKSAMGYLNSAIKGMNKKSNNIKSNNVYAEIANQLNGDKVIEEQIFFVDDSLPRGIYNIDELNLIPSNIDNNRVIPAQKPTVVNNGTINDIEITYDGKTFVGDIKVVIDVITALHTVNQ